MIQKKKNKDKIVRLTSFVKIPFSKKARQKS